MGLVPLGKIISIETRGSARTGRAQFGDAEQEICLDFVREASVGDYIIAHLGFAISRLDPETAERSCSLLKSTGLLRETIVQVRSRTASRTNRRSSI